MSSRSKRPRTRRELSRAELKAYEARRAAERRRIPSTPAAEAEPAKTVHVPTEHSFAISRDAEFAIIRSDLQRLLIILAVLAVALVVITIILR